LNGEAFYLPLSKGDVGNTRSAFVRDLKFPKGNFIKAINYLQTIKYELDITYFNYIREYLDFIKINMFGFNYTRLDIDKIKQQYLASNKKDKALLKKLQETISILSKIEQLDRELKISEEYFKYEHFYFVYNVDFRGRIYVLSDVLNYQTSKLIKGGLRYFIKVNANLNNSFWFKIQCVKQYLGNVNYTAIELVNYFDNYLKEKIIN
jgi:hypothetical protein